MWSWKRAPLADAETHELRKKLKPLLDEIGKALTPRETLAALLRRTGVKSTKYLIISEMNAATAKKTITAAEDIVMDIMSGEIRGGRNK